MYIRKRGKKYQVEKTVNGKRVYKTFKTLKEAKAW